MDQPLKARLIGATVLVVLAVLLIPELLSGRKATSPPTQGPATNDHRTFTIDIGKSGGTMTAPAVPATQPAPSPTATDGSVAPAAARSSVAGPGEAAGMASPGADAAAKSPSAPNGASPASGTGATTAGEPASVTAATPAAAPRVPPPVAGRSGQYFVQVGAFSSGDAARKLVAQLEADGYSTQVSPVVRGGKTLHRVRVGPTVSRADAQQLAERLKSRGLPATLVTSE